MITANRDSSDLTTGDIHRRRFLKSIAVAAAGAALASTPGAAQIPRKRNIKLGLDNFAVRAMGWKAPQLIDYSASLKLDSLFISDLDALEQFEPAYLKTVRSRAEDNGLQIHLGTWSVCPTSVSFKNKWGTADEHLSLAIRCAKSLGSPVLRVVLGNGEDRNTPGGIEARIADTAKVLKAHRSEAVDAGVKLAIENHAGDMQAWEVVTLIEMAGKDFVGANLDSGNALWTLEEPVSSLEILGPYAVTTSLRDSAVWESENGATVQWTAMGDGTTDLKTYFERFETLCKGVPVHIETISGFNREIPFLKPGFWKAWPKAKAADLAKFVALARQGKPRDAWKAPEGVDRKKADQDYQKSEIERSLRFCKDKLGLGLKT